MYEFDDGSRGAAVDLGHNVRYRFTGRSVSLYLSRSPSEDPLMFTREDFVAQINYFRFPRRFDPLKIGCVDLD